jgi:hypothetical protein
MSEKLQEALIKVRLKIAFAPLRGGGAGGGAQLRQREKANHLCARAFSPRGISFWVSTRSCAPPLTPPKREGNLLIRVSFSLSID